jgi:hypothetical protein
MKLTRSQKIVLAVLAVAITALVVDRLFLASSATGPRQARASSADAAPAPPEADPVQAPEAAAAAEAATRFAERLEAAAERFELDPAAMRDGFTLEAAWREELAGPPEPVQQAEAEPQPSPADQFAGAHTLTSVVLTTKGGSAVVDGRVVPLGHDLDGFTLVRLTQNTAVFEADGEEVELRLRR